MNTIFSLNYKMELPILKSIPEIFLRERIEVLTKHGYAYNLYDLAFYNFQLRDVIPGTELKTLTPEIIEIRRQVAETNIKNLNNGKIFSQEQGESIIKNTFKFKASRYKYWFEMLSGLIEVSLIILTIVLFFAGRGTVNDFSLYLSIFLNLTGVSFLSSCILLLIKCMSSKSLI